MCLWKLRYQKKKKTIFVIRHSFSVVSCILDVVYAVVYSLLLLNTDLHVAQGTYARMTKQAFVKNTMSTIFDQSSVKTSKTWEMNVETYLKVSRERKTQDGLLTVVYV